MQNKSPMQIIKRLEETGCSSLLPNPSSGVTPFHDAVWRIAAVAGENFRQIRVLHTAQPFQLVPETGFASGNGDFYDTLPAVKISEIHQRRTSFCKKALEFRAVNHGRLRQMPFISRGQSAENRPDESRKTGAFPEQNAAILSISEPSVVMLPSVRKMR